MDDDKIKEVMAEVRARMEKTPPSERRYFLPYYEKGVYKGMRTFSYLEYRQYLDALASECKFEEDI